MSCWCGHGPWHRYAHGRPPQYYYPSGAYHDQAHRRGCRRRSRDPEELEDYLRDLQEEIDRVRQDLAAIRESGEGES
jgi:hypothetical protein